MEAVTITRSTPRSGRAVVTLLFSILVLLASHGLPADQPTATPVLRVGSELGFRPYAYADEKGQAIGFSTDLIKAVANAMGIRLQITTGPWDVVWNGLLSGQFDVLPTVARTPGREPLLDFSLPHTETFDALFVRTGQAPLPSLAAAAGKELVVLRSDAAHHQLVERKFNGKVIPVDSIADGLRLIAAGKHDAFLCSKVIGVLEQKQHGIKGVKSGPPIPEYKRVFSFAVRKGNTEILEKLNQGLLIIKANGEYDRIYQRWLTTDEPWRKWIPYFQWAIAGLVLLAVLVAVLQFLIHRRTRQLARANEEIKAEVAERRKAEQKLQDLNATLEQRVAERTRAMQETEQRLARIARAGRIGFFEWNASRDTVYWNAEHYEIFGYEPGSPVSYKRWLKRVHPDDREIVTRVVSRLIARDEQMPAERYEYRILSEDGKVCWLECDFTIEVKDDEKIVRGCVRDVTERKQAEEKLRASEAKYRQLFMNMAEEVHFWQVVRDDQGRIKTWRLIDINPPALTTWGHKSIDDVRGKTTDEIFGPGATEHYLPIVQRIMTEGVPFSYEDYFPHLEKHFRFNSVPLGEYFITTGADITAMKKAHEALRQSEEFNRSVVQNTSAIILRVDLQSRITFANRRALEFFGYSKAELIGKNAIGTIVPERDSSGRDLAGLIQGIANDPDKYHSNVNENMRKDGERVWLEWTNSGIYDSKGQMKEFLSVGIDITERRRARAALQESEERFRVAQELSPDGFTIFRPVRNEQGRIIDFTWVYENAAIGRLNGTDPRMVIGRRLLELMPNHDKTPFHKIYQEVAETGQPQVAEALYQGDTVPRPTWFRVAVVAMEKDIAVLAQDVTKQKEFQAELEREVAERTIKLQELVGELEHFSYTITHDLKSPLRAMKGFAEMALETSGESQPGHKEFLRRISTAADRMDALIRDSLNYSRAVRQELPLEDVDVGALLRGMLESYPELQPSKAHIRIDGLLPLVLGNQAGLTQCLSNLLGNAVKFVKPGEIPDVRVWAEEKDSWARIWVEDKGIGISKEMLPRVFDMFSRESKSYEGTGIGLALVRKVVQRMGGKVGVESEKGKGSRFWIELKLGEVKPAQLTASSLRSDAKGGWVLYVEDEESDALFMERAFAARGLKPTLQVVGDGRAAMDYLSGAGKYADRQSYPLPAIVLLDLNLPGVPGFEVLKWMRNHPDFVSTPVIVFSSSTRDDDKVKARELGANEFIAKPRSGMEYGGVVDKLLEKWLGNGLERR